MFNTDLQLDAAWVVELQACIRVHTHAALLNNALLLGSEVAFLLLMASGIYMHNSGLRAFKIMYREVRDHRPTSGRASQPSHHLWQGLLWLSLAIVMQIIPVVSTYIYALGDLGVDTL